MTLAWPEWIEGLFGIDPDAGSGLAEWTMTGLSLLTALLAGARARTHWRAAAARL